MSNVVAAKHHPFRTEKARERYLAHYDARSAAWPVQSQDLLVVGEYESTFVRVSGEEDAPPLVLLPGEWDSSLMWIPVIEALSRDHRTYAIDSPYDFGRGSSTKTWTSPVDHVRWLNEVLDGLGIDSDVRLIGCSFGAWITADYLLRSPERLSKAVWLSPPFAVISPPAGSYVGAPLSAGAYMTPNRLSVTAYLRWLMPHAVSAPWFAQRVEDVVLGLKGTDAYLPLAEPRMLSDEELAGISVPLLYVAGELEQMCSVSEAVQRLNRVAPQIETAVLPGAGHELPYGNTEAFLERVQRFLTS